MSVAAKNLIAAQYAENSLTTEYTATSVRAIIDKFTATNITGGAVTVTVHLVPSGGSADNTNKIIDAFSISANTAKDFSELQNQILNAGDFIAVVASAASSIVIRCSGREIS